MINLNANINSIISNNNSSECNHQSLSQLSPVNQIKLVLKEKVKNEEKLNELQLGKPSSSKNHPFKIRGCSFKLICTALTCILTCSLPSGYNLGVINTPQKILKNFCNSTILLTNHDVSKNQLDLIWSVIVSIFLIGAMIGSLVASWLADVLGRKPSVLVTSVLALSGSSFMFASKSLQSVTLIMMGRLFVGIHCGIASSLVPLYLMEVSPKRLKSPMGVMHTLGLTIGLLISQILGQDHFLGSAQRWPILLSFFTVFIFIGYITFFNTPESPSYLLKMDKEDRAFETLKSLYGKQYESEVFLDFLELKQDKKSDTSDSSTDSNSSGLWSMLKSKEVRKPFFLVILLHIGQQMSGINAVFYYSTKIFEDVGLDEYQSQIGSIITGSLNVLMSLVSVHVLNKFQIKTLMMASTSLSVLFLISLTVNITLQSKYVFLAPGSMFLVMAFVVSYGLGMGPIPYMIGSSLLSSKNRSVGMSIGCFFNWFCNFIVGITFPILQSYVNQYVFLIFASFTFLTFIVVIINFKGEKSENSTCSTSSTDNC